MILKAVEENYSSLQTAVLFNRKISPVKVLMKLRDRNLLYKTPVLFLKPFYTSQKKHGNLKARVTVKNTDITQPAMHMAA